MKKSSKQLEYEASIMERQLAKKRELIKRQTNIEQVLKVFGSYKISASELNKAIDVFNAEIEANEKKPVKKEAKKTTKSKEASK